MEFTGGSAVSRGVTLMRRGIGALFVAFLAVRVMTTTPAAPTQSAASPQQSKTSPLHNPVRTRGASNEGGEVPAPKDPCERKSEKCPKKGLLDAAGDSLGPSEHDADLEARVKKLSDGARNARFLIATVPNPVHTHLGLLFDRQIVAIEEAVQQGGYLFSRAYLPWDNVQHPEDTDFSLRLKEEDYQDSRENYPGLLLFHYRESLGGQSGALGPLLVFLVAETPTGGIDKGQFSNAIAAINGLCNAGCAQPQPLGKTGQLFILGPTFSGSFYSLRDVLTEQRKNLSSVVIHSGTATDNGTIKWFNDLQKDSLPVSVTFRTFEEGSDYELSHLLSFVCRQGFHAEQMAVLSEDETAYGAGRIGVQGNKKNDASGETCLNEDDKVLHLFFPRDISALRNAYQEDSKVSGASSNSAAPRSTLSLNLEDHGNNDDSVAIFSQDQTPLSEEAVMMGIVSDLREHRTNLVVIEATNPVDIVFLVRYLRTAYSDARIFTLGSDLLLPRQEDDPRLRGVMQVSSYSLIPEIDHYTTTTDDGCGQPSFLNRVFPSDYSVGTFNAVLSLMEFQGSAYKSCSSAVPPPTSGDLISSAYVQYGWPTLAGPPRPDRAFVPPLWLTIQGRNQFWPVELLDGADTKAEQRKHETLLHAIWSSPAKDPPHRPAMPPSWNILAALGAAFALTYVLLARSGTVYSASTFLANFAPVDNLWRRLTTLICGVIIFDILICLLWPYFWFSGYATWIALFIFAVLGFMIVEDLMGRGGRVFLIVFSVLVVLTWVSLLAAFGLGHETVRRLMLYRYAHFASGVSPVVPFLILFAACLWMCWHNLSGRPPWDRDGTGPKLPSYAAVISKTEFAGESPADRERLGALTDERNPRLLDAMAARKLNWRILLPASIACVLLTLGGIVPSSPLRIQSFEGPAYDRVYTIFVVTILFVLLKDAFRAGLIWLELRRLLMALDRLPLRRGFARLAGFNSKRLWQLGGNTFEDYLAILSKEIQTATALVYSPPIATDGPDELRATTADVAHFAWWIQNLDSKVLKEEMKSAGGTQAICDCLLDLQLTLTAACGAVLRELNETWNKERRHVWDAECMLLEKTQCDEKELPLRVRLCEDFVCLFYLKFISSVFTRIRSLVLSIVGLYVFVLLSFGSYPFEPISTFHTAMVFLLIFIVVVIGIVYGQAEKNATLSRITQTNVGELGVEFWFRLAAVISVPLLSLLAAKFPEISGFLFSWLEPASQAFR
jgi:hypothetical protein